MEEHVPTIVVDVCSSRRHQTVSIACLEERLFGTRVGPRDRGCSGVVYVVVLVRVAICREEQVPSAFAVEKIGCFDDTLVGDALVVQDGCCGSLERDAVSS